MKLTLPDDSVHPTMFSQGLTKRELFSLAILHAIMSLPPKDREGVSATTIAVQAADLLMLKLNNDQAVTND